MSKERKRKEPSNSQDDEIDNTPSSKLNKPNDDHAAAPLVGFDHHYIVAPMVGASELPFRLLCRKYGAQLVYTPMMIASQFVASPEYRARELQTTPFDRPLVCHFAANTPREFAAAAKLAEPHCDAIDLNLGCPQRTAYVGHFGSYLLEDEDRDLVVSIVKAGVEAVKVPIFCKIRLLETYERTAELCRQLYEAGASLIAVHARYRASFHRKGPGARDGPAMLDQVQKLKQEFSAGKYSNRLLVTNGNTITYEDVVKNLETTKADGIMSAEGILDDPALYLGRLGSREEAEKNDIVVEVKGGKVFDEWPKRDKWMKKMAFIKQVEAKIQKDGKDSLNRKEKKKLLKKEKLLSKLKNCSKNGSTTFPLRKLYEAADDSVGLALEYLELVRQFPAVMRTVIFHTRRIAKQELTKYQLMEECLACTSVDEVERVLNKIRIYQQNPELFVFDIEKSKTEKEALERKKIEESKRKAYEARMVRKAKREGKTDLEFYLRQGAAVPTLETVEEMKSLSKEEQMKLWKDRDHSQHCMAFHLSGECPRGRGCAFLHVASHTKNSFVESDEVAG